MNDLMGDVSVPLWVAITVVGFAIAGAIDSVVFVGLFVYRRRQKRRPTKAALIVSVSPGNLPALILHKWGTVPADLPAIEAVTVPPEVAATLEKLAGGKPA